MQAAPDKVYSTKAGQYTTNPIVVDLNGKTLKAGTDYEKAFVYKSASGNVLDKSYKAATGEVITITVKGKGNYTGEISGTYRIIPKTADISKAKLSKQIVKEYTGNAIELSKSDIALKLNNQSVDSFEIVSYTNNVKKGTAKVLIKGVGNYGGVKTISFRIKAFKVKK